MNLQQMMMSFRRQIALAVLIAMAPLGVALGAIYDVPSHLHYDARFAHNQLYLNRGYVVHSLPQGYVIANGPERFWYSGGVWYRQYRPGWVVVGAPFGAFVPVLPHFYTTVWFAGVPYYYANDTYYLWDSDRLEYEVVAPPPGIESAGTTQAPSSDTQFIYPKNGQSPEQQARDRYDCYHSAVQLTGYDPTRSGRGVAPVDAKARRTDYFRADDACLDARGYSVK
jgi:hypothetical protein